MLLRENWNRRCALINGRHPPRPACLRCPGSHQETVTAVASVQRSLGRGDRVTFEQWWPRFQAAAATHDAKTVAAGVKFPLNWENGPVREIKTEAELLRRFDDYFTSEIRKIIAGRKPERLGNGRYIITWKARGMSIRCISGRGGRRGLCWMDYPRVRLEGFTGWARIPSSGWSCSRCRWAEP